MNPFSLMRQITEEIKAELQDGVLKVSVPVSKQESKSRQVPIPEGIGRNKPSAKA